MPAVVAVAAESPPGSQLILVEFASDISLLDFSGTIFTINGDSYPGGSIQDATHVEFGTAGGGCAPGDAWTVNNLPAGMNPTSGVVS